MFVKPRDVPPLLCFNVQMRFGVEQLLFPEGMRCKKAVLLIQGNEFIVCKMAAIWPRSQYVSCYSLTVVPVLSDNLFTPFINTD